MPWTERAQEKVGRIDSSGSKQQDKLWWTKSERVYWTRDKCNVILPVMTLRSYLVLVTTQWTMSNRLNHALWNYVVYHKNDGFYGVVHCLAFIVKSTILLVGLWSERDGVYSDFHYLACRSMEWKRWLLLWPHPCPGHRASANPLGGGHDPVVYLLRAWWGHYEETPGIQQTHQVVYGSQEGSLFSGESVVFFLKIKARFQASCKVRFSLVLPVCH